VSEKFPANNNFMMYLSENRLSNFSLVGVSVLIFSIIFSSFGCGGKTTAEQKTSPAKVENPVKETELSTVTLTPEAEERLKIAVAAIVAQPVRETREYSGEVVLPPDSLYNVTAPIAGTLVAQSSTPDFGTPVRKGQTVFKIMPIITPAEREQRALLERDTNIAETAASNDIETAKTRVEAAKLRLNRAEELVKVGGGSVKAAEAAREDLRVAEIALKAARQRLAETKKIPAPEIVPVDVKAPRDGVVQRLHVAAGQTVASGTMLFEAATFSSVLIRVPVYVGELSGIAQRAPARIHGLNDTNDKGGRLAQPTTAPPSADANAATADLYFILPNGDGTLRPGQRVGATLAVNNNTGNQSVAPWAAVLHDINGGTWVYEVIAPHKYIRRRVVVARVVDDLAVLSEGPPAGTSIVTAGASELFGTEFSTGK
jgi:multidrug efflux pump subunit AcrA (membrane-fusion protein)